jgi:hypothetical protein
LRCTYQKKGAITIGRLEKGDAFGDECVVHSEATKNILRRRKALSGKFSQQGGEGEEEGGNNVENNVEKKGNEYAETHNGEGSPETAPNHDDDTMSPRPGGGSSGNPKDNETGGNIDSTTTNYAADDNGNAVTTISGQSKSQKAKSITDFPSDFPVVDVNAKPCLVSATAGHLMLIRDMDAFKRYITARHAYHFQPK